MQRTPDLAGDPRFSRRAALGGSVAAVALAALSLPARAAVDEAIARFTDGRTPDTGELRLSVPEVAENASSVPVTLEAPGAAEVALFAPDNPDPHLCTCRFGPLSGRQEATVRVRLAGSQRLRAVARMADGSLIEAASTEIAVSGDACAA